MPCGLPGNWVVEKAGNNKLTGSGAYPSLLDMSCLRGLQRYFPYDVPRRPLGVLHIRLGQVGGLILRWPGTGRIP